LARPVDVRADAAHRRRSSAGNQHHRSRVSDAGDDRHDAADESILPIRRSFCRKASWRTSASIRHSAARE
jgi:hypothetical protein